MKQFMTPDPMLLEEETDDSNPRFTKLNKAIAHLVDDFSMVNFLPLDCASESKSVATIISYIDDITQWAENQEPKELSEEPVMEEEYVRRSF